MIAAAVVQIDCEQDAIVIGTELENELFFALHAEDAVRVAENVAAEADFEAVLDAIRFGMVGKT